MNASISSTPASRQASTMPCASSAVIASGFSHSTCFPARAAAIVHRACRWLGSGMYTASTSGSASSASYDPWARGIPSRRAALSARSASREAIARTSQPAAFWMPGMTFSTAMFAVDSTPQRTADTPGRPGSTITVLLRGCCARPLRGTPT